MEFCCDAVSPREIESSRCVVPPSELDDQIWSTLARFWICLDNSSHRLPNWIFTLQLLREKDPRWSYSEWPWPWLCCWSCVWQVSRLSVFRSSSSVGGGLGPPPRGTLGQQKIGVWTLNQNNGLTKRLYSAATHDCRCCCSGPSVLMGKSTSTKLLSMPFLDSLMFLRSAGDGPNLNQTCFQLWRKTLIWAADACLGGETICFGRRGDSPPPQSRKEYLSLVQGRVQVL